jgi:HD-GYP domain-containing protein (c-di-GMP phosphodiesterase class II)
VYVNILKQLAKMIDNLNPYTVGYSEMMSRYSIVIGKQLGMPEEEIRDLALAAYLSNIGVLGLSNDLYQKEGKFTEAEYEMMKLHAEVGASMVSVTTGNKRVASYIMYHHERIDGAGYPAGLRGADIPLGARIIGVVQTFLAKINGRKGRDPLPFDRALEMLQSAAGTQLDKQVVQAFVAWFESKQQNPAFSERSLGHCWEMCCTPSSICEHCPVYQQSGGTAFKNCWEYEGNLCSSHGKSCSTCFVRTEYTTRSEVKRRA